MACWLPGQRLTTPKAALLCLQTNSEQVFGARISFLSLVVKTLRLPAGNNARGKRSGLRCQL